MSAWGNSWGGAWGNSWGAFDTVDTAAPPQHSGGPSARRGTDFNDDELIELAIAIIMSGALDG